jgi:hypothetical protein
LAENFRKITDKLYSTGIIQYLLKQHAINYYGKVIRMDENVSMTLKLKDFKCVFILWIALIGVSTISFIFEYLAMRIKETSVELLRNCYGCLYTCGVWGS